MELSFHASTLDVTLFENIFHVKTKSIIHISRECLHVCVVKKHYMICFLSQKQTPFHFLSNFKSQEYER